MDYLPFIVDVLLDFGSKQIISQKQHSPMTFMRLNVDHPLGE